jgi:uncharacterized membrane protein YdjX (TVP38/TMEM64 family)
MLRFLRQLALLALVLAIPIVPFLVLGDSFETRLMELFGPDVPPLVVATLVAGLLASDVVLPVPSSIVSTLAGRVLGFWGGTAASWVGMTAGAVIAFAAARAFGRPLAVRLAGEEEMARVDALAVRLGALVLVVARPVPAFAEASVLLMGVTRLGWTPMLVAVGLSNLGIAAAYSALGDRVQLPVALAASVVLPLLLAAAARAFWPRGSNEEAEEM